MNAKDVDLLRRSDLFRFLPDEHFERIRRLLQEERHDFGDLIVKQGEPASAFYILISGRARVVKSGANNRVLQGRFGSRFHSPNFEGVASRNGIE